MSRQRAEKGGASAQAFGRSRGGFTCKVHARCDNQGRPLGFILTGGEASDYDAVDALMAIPVTKPKALLADKGYDDDTVRENLLMQGILPIIPPRLTAASLSHATSAAIVTETASSVCSPISSSFAASPHDTTNSAPLRQFPKPRRHTQMAASLCPRDLVIAGSKAGGERAATIYSVIETAKLNSIKPRPTLPMSSRRSLATGLLDELMPCNWRTDQQLIAQAA